MKVNLIKSAEYEMDTEKLTALPSDIFTTLVGTPEAKVEKLQSVIYFENKEKFLKNAVLDELDLTKNIFVSTKGQIFCYLKEDNASAGTEEDKGEES